MLWFCVLTEFLYCIERMVGTSDIDLYVVVVAASGTYHCDRVGGILS
jgi:hypothetical protein